MGFKIPEYLESYLSSYKYRKPLDNFVNNSNYYININYFWQNYMLSVVRPCIAYGSGIVDGVHGNLLSMSTGKAIVRGATKLIRGDKLFFEGNQVSCRFLSDIWAPSTNFSKLLTRTVEFMCTGGSSLLKLNKDLKGRYSFSSFRLDRTLVSVDENGRVNDAIFYISLLSSLKSDGYTDETWLVEHRKYNKEGVPVIVYKVFTKSGIANSVVLPDPYSAGIPFKNLSPKIQRELLIKGIKSLNKETVLPFKNLGVWKLDLTATNSAIPDSTFGDPLLYGILDLLWSIDVVFSGSLIDVLNGEGKIIVPKQFIADIKARLNSMYPGQNLNISTQELDSGGDESFVYIKWDGFDKERQAPTPVQFDIRTEQYKGMLDMYIKEMAVRTGFSPTSLFPHLAGDLSAKSATEVTAEENLTRATVKSIHDLILPTLNEAINEVLRLEGFKGGVRLKLSDYIGNRIQFDANLRANYQAGLIPKKIAVQQINNLSLAETEQYLKWLDEDMSAGQVDFNDTNYFGEMNGEERQTQQADNNFGRSGDETEGDYQGKLLQQLTPASNYGASQADNPKRPERLKTE